VRELFKDLWLVVVVAIIVMLVLAWNSQAYCFNCMGVCKSNSQCVYPCACAKPNIGWGRCVNTLP
jgi:hypothetical protein